MLQALTSAVSGLNAFQQEIDVIGNDIANVSTIAYKSATTDLADSFSQTLANSDLGGDSSVQIGLGVVTAGIFNQFNQGAINPTGVATDLAISGNGFFVVKDAISGAEFVTRAGDFQLDASGYLVTPGGLRVQGYTDPSLTTLGDIKIDASNMPAADAAVDATMTSYAIDQQGRVDITLSDGTTYVTGQILMQNFSNPNGLVKEGNNLYGGIGVSGPIGGAVDPTPAAPGTNGMGTIQSGALEQSNVDLSSEFASLIQTQRAFQANARIITTSDEMLQDLVDMKH
ncbi:MAG TPA: flagellar hook-basal body complex protein [Verrucomicrobiae bacterium]|nr:flagellar hook-basal body complex protein [Verrucomicrobiae bacterium]